MALLVVAGPCVLQDREGALAVARRLADISSKLNVTAVFKASYDKANRTKRSSYRGPGLAAGRVILEGVKEETGLQLLVDVHTPQEAREAGAFADVLQVPALLCRQTDLVQAVAGQGRVVNIKKGQFLSPDDMANVVDKARAAGAREVWVTERGHAFGYRDLVVDMRSLVVLSDLGVRVLLDPCHGGQAAARLTEPAWRPRRFIAPLARAGVAAGAGGVYLEVHPKPEESPSDGPSSLPLERLPGLVRELVAIRAALALEPSLMG